MDEVADTEEPTARLLPLWVVVTSGQRASTFELDGERHRTIVIGSSRDSEYCVVDARLAPIECFLEREGDEIWLVPGDPSGELRVDTALVARPTRLWRRCVVDVASITFSVRIREEPPTSPDHEIPTRRGACWPTMDATLADATTMDATTMDASLSSLVPWALSNPRAAAEYPSQVSALDNDEKISIRNIVAIEAEAPYGGSTKMPAVPSVLDEMRPIAGVLEPKTVEGGATPRQLDALESPPSSTSPAVASHRGPPSVPTLRLEQLGVFAIQRPWLMLTGVISGAMALASAMHFGTQAVVALRHVDTRAQTTAIGEYSKLVGACPGSAGAPVAPIVEESLARRARCQRLPAITVPSVFGKPNSLQLEAAVPVTAVSVAPVEKPRTAR